MSNPTPYFDPPKFIDQIVNEIKSEIKINFTEETEKKLREIILDRLNSSLIDALFDSMGTAEVHMFNALQNQYPETDPSLILLYLSQINPQIEEKVREHTKYLKKGMIDLAKKIKDMD